jgi:hypothetical protein
MKLQCNYLLQGLLYRSETTESKFFVPVVDYAGLTNDLL